MYSTRVNMAASLARNRALRHDSGSPVQHITTAPLIYSYYVYDHAATRICKPRPISRVEWTKKGQGKVGMQVCILSFVVESQDALIFFLISFPAGGKVDIIRFLVETIAILALLFATEDLIRNG